MAKANQLRKWLAPCVPYTVVLEDADGKHEHKFKLAFDFNAFAVIEKHLGINLLAEFAPIFNISASSISVFFWAAALAYQPEYGNVSSCPKCGTEIKTNGDSTEGLEVIRSYFNAGNFEPAALAVQEAFKLNLNPEQCAIVEKAIADVLALVAAKAAGRADEIGGAVPLDQQAPAQE